MLWIAYGCILTNWTEQNPQSFILGFQSTLMLDAMQLARLDYQCGAMGHSAILKFEERRGQSS